MESGIRTPDQRVRVFVSSTLGEVAGEREVVRAAVECLRLTPVMFELGARPHAPRDLYRAYLAQSDIFIGLYWERYGWVAPGAAVSGLEDEYTLGGDLPRLLYVKEPAPRREPRLRDLVERIEAEGTGCYRRFSTSEELAELVQDDLALVLSERFLSSGAPACRLESRTGGRPRDQRAALPVFPTTLIGREALVADVCDLVEGDDVRLVTLTGPGGIGKTRLAVACAGRLLPGYPGGARFVSLAALRDPDLVLSGVASALGASTEHRRRPLDAVAAHFDDRPALLVLDNLEQVVSVGPHLVDLLTAAPRLTLLVTSRAPLRVRGEHEYPVPALGLPCEQPGWTRRLAAVPAVSLFVDRARAVRRDFELTAENAFAVAEICRRLDGLPLAIEIAAARVRLLPPDALLTRLTTRLDALGSGPSDLPDRQRTLRATIDWSYDLLDEESARALAMLAVFVDGWTLEAAARVCERDDLEMLEVLDVLSGQSLVVTAAAAAEPRFGMLATVRDYAGELLDRSDERDAVSNRHAAYCCDLVEAAQRPIRGDDQAAWVARLDAEHGNLRAAIRWLLDRGDGERVSELMWGAVLSWWLKGHLLEVRPWVHEALGLLEGLNPDQQAKLLTATAVVALEVGDDDEVRSCVERTRELLDEHGDPVVQAVALLFKGYTLPSFGDLESAQRCIETALDAFRALDEPFYTGLATTSLGGFLCVAGDLPGARRYQEEAVTIARRIRNSHLLAQSLTELAVVAVLEERPGEARTRLEEASGLLAEADAADGSALALAAYARLAALEGDAAGAARALASAEAVRGRVGIVVWPSYREAEGRLAADLRVTLGPDAYGRAVADGRAVTAQEALAAAARSASAVAVPAGDQAVGSS
jgi:predicted ATPase